MKKIGIIVEYNPLHNGHIYHLNKIKELANPDLIVAVCSSTFTMRGDLSMFDKFSKTKQALKAGCDIVIELSAIQAVNNADIFAYNAVSALAKAKVDELWIGSERNDTTIYEKYYLVEEQEEFQQLIKENLGNGFSYKVAYNMALHTYSLGELDANDTLGLSYYKALRKLSSSIKLKTIERIGSIENTKEIQTNYPSASAIRASFNPIYVPFYVSDDYKKGYFDINQFYPYLQYLLFTTSLKEFFFIEEGIENHLKKYVNAKNMEEFISLATNKRYTSTRIKRTIFYLLFQITKKEIEKTKTEPFFLRILGASTNGLVHLNSIKKNTLLYTNIKEGLNTTLDIELRITKIVDLIFHTNLFSQEQNFIKSS